MIGNRSANRGISSSKIVTALAREIPEDDIPLSIHGPRRLRRQRHLGRLGSIIKRVGWPKIENINDLGNLHGSIRAVRYIDQAKLTRTLPTPTHILSANAFQCKMMPLKRAASWVWLLTSANSYDSKGCANTCPG